jgi:hypothetical protein
VIQKLDVPSSRKTEWCCHVTIMSFISYSYKKVYSVGFPYICICLASCCLHCSFLTICRVSVQLTLCYFTEKIWKLETLLRKCKESIRRNKERISQLTLENQQLQQTLTDTKVSRTWSCMAELGTVELNADGLRKIVFYWTVCCPLVFVIACWHVNFCLIFGCSG